MYFMSELRHTSEITPVFADKIRNASFKAAFGLIISKETGNLLVALRSSEVASPNTYSIFGGQFDDYESPDEALEREIFEETGYPIFGTYKPLSIQYDSNNDAAFHTHIAFSPEDFEPQLNWEHDSAEWMSLEKLKEIPENMLHQGMLQLINNPLVFDEILKITQHYTQNMNKECAVKRNDSFDY